MSAFFASSLSRHSPEIVEEAPVLRSSPATEDGKAGVGSSERSGRAVKVAPAFSCLKCKRSGDHEPEAWDGGNGHHENQ